MQSGKVSLPIQVCQPRSFALAPKINRLHAFAHAGSRKDKVFRFKSLFKKKAVAFNLLQRRLVPFWHVRCKSRFHYDRNSNYALVAQDADAVEIRIQGADDQELTYSINPKDETRQALVHGIERCLTERDVTELISAHQDPDAAKITRKAKSFFQDEQKRLTEYLESPTREIDDFAIFYHKALLGEKPVYSDLEDEKVQIVLPDKAANRVVSDVMKKVMVSIDPVSIHDWSITVDFVDLYFHPYYVFEFQREDQDGNVVETRLEQLDALNGTWGIISAQDVKQSTVPWNKIFHLTIDATAVVLQELGGPWLNVASGLIGVGSQHIPGIMGEMKKPDNSE